MKKIILVLMILLVLPFVSATLTDNLDSYIAESTRPWWLKGISQMFSISGPRTVQPYSSVHYDMILDTNTGNCQGNPNTKITWYAKEEGEPEVQILSSYPLSYCVGALCTSLDYVVRDVSLVIRVVYDCGVYSNTEYAYITVETQCSNQCSSGQKKCYDSKTRQDCEYQSGCYIWGTTASCGSNQYFPD